MASISPSPKLQFFSNNGVPLAGGKLYTYVAGSLSIPQTTYTDSTGVVPNTNPIILDSRGEANVWLTEGLFYALKLTDSLDTLIWTEDNIGGLINQSSIHTATSKTTPVDADEFPIVDSATSFTLKKLTFANLKATLKAYFDPIYQAIGSYAALAGSALQTFAVATPTTSTQAVPLGFFAPITASLSADVLLNNTANYFTGPQIAQGTVGTWYVSGNVCAVDTAGAWAMRAILWDGTTVIDSSVVVLQVNVTGQIHLSGIITAPAGNLRISVKDPNSASGVMTWTASTSGKDCTITAIRIG